MVVLPRFYIKAISSFPLSVLSQSWIRSRHKLVNWVLRQTVSLAPNINWHISQTESLSAFPILTLTSQLCFIVQGHMTQNQNIHTGESVLFLSDGWLLETNGAEVKRVTSASHFFSLLSYRLARNQPIRLKNAILFIFLEQNWVVCISSYWEDFSQTLFTDLVGKNTLCCLLWSLFWTYKNAQVAVIKSLKRPTQVILLYWSFFHLPPSECLELLVCSKWLSGSRWFLQ